MNIFRNRQWVPQAIVLAGAMAAVFVGPPFFSCVAETVATMPAPTGYVDDYAGVLSVPAKSELASLCTEIHDKTRAQVFFVTIKSLDEEDMDAFANQLFHKWKIGEKKTDRGILLILAIKEHKRRIEVGYGFEGILNDAKAGDIGREMVPALKASNYDEAARIGVRDVAAVIAADSKVTLTGVNAADTTEGSSALREDAPPPIPEGIGQRTPFPFVPMAIFSVLFFGGFGLFAFVVVRNIRRGVRFGGGGGGIGSSADSGSSFSSDSSSSSDSFGGGDGGDSGGGGAGGSW